MLQPRFSASFAKRSFTVGVVLYVITSVFFSFIFSSPLVYKVYFFLDNRHDYNVYFVYTQITDLCRKASTVG